MTAPETPSTPEHLVGMALNLSSQWAERIGHRSTDGPLFVLPIPAGSRPTPNASWITTGGLASAARQRWGEAWVVTPNGIFSPEEVLERASKLAKSSGPIQRRFRWVPQIVRTAAKDVRLLIRAMRFRKAVSRSSSIGDCFDFVWQRHVPFHRAGLALGKSVNCPVILSVHALMVQEARQWGVRRPGWGSLMERFGEKRLIQEADLVACVSNEVAELVRSKGVSEDRIIVTPNGVDLQRFRPTKPDLSTQRKLGLDGDRFVLGWVGSFRAFHGLERLLDAMEDLQNRGRSITLLLIGTGPGLQTVKAYVDQRDIRNISFAGGFPHDRMPQVLSVLHAAVVMGPPGTQFHYSPVKIREYMAMGLPVIAGRLGELDRILTDGNDAILVDPSSTAELTRAIETLMDDPELRTRLGVQARQRIARIGSWEDVLKNLIDRIHQLEDS